VNPKTRIASKRRLRFLNGIDVSAFLAIQLAILFLFLGEVTPVDVRRPAAACPPLTTLAGCLTPTGRTP